MADIIGEYDQRQNEIDNKLTPEIVKSIIMDHLCEINVNLKNNRFIMIAYSSTQSLLRRINGVSKDKLIGIQYLTKEEALDYNPNSQLLKTFDPVNTFCVAISTYLPLSYYGMGDDQLILQCITCFELNILR